MKIVMWIVVVAPTVDELHASEVTAVKQHNISINLRFFVISQQIFKQFEIQKDFLLSSDDLILNEGKGFWYEWFHGHEIAMQINQSTDVHKKPSKIG